MKEVLLVVAGGAIALITAEVGHRRAQAASRKDALRVAYERFFAASDYFCRLLGRHSHLQVSHLTLEPGQLKEAELAAADAHRHLEAACVGVELLEEDRELGEMVRRFTDTRDLARELHAAWTHRDIGARRELTRVAIDGHQDLRTRLLATVRRRLIDSQEWQ